MAGSAALRSVVGQAVAERLLGHDCQRGIDAALAWSEQPGNRIITLADSDYPQALLKADDPPVLLYAKGRTELLNRPAIAIVGSRNATKQGEATADHFAATLSRAGLTVVSGLALGIDAAAHRGALGMRGSTIAVIGTGADRIYPSRNEDLARQIADQGVIISDFPLGTPAVAANFPRRNRLIAGLGRGCLVVEAAERSGSLITARLAAEAGLEVFAIPGSIHSPLSKGCHKLIKQGAKLVECAQDILEELHPQAASTVSVAQTDDRCDLKPEHAALLKALGHEPATLDQLISRCGLAADAVLAMLTELNLDGVVTNLPGGRYQRLIRA